MRTNLQQILKSSSEQEILFWCYALISLLGLFTAVATGIYAVAGVPLALAFVYLTIVDFRVVFYLLLFCLPLSTEIILPNGLGTDLPTEPLMVGLAFVFLLYALRHGKAAIQPAFLLHPITLLLFLHWGWVGISALTSSLFWVSGKFFLAKSWYILTFYFLAGYLLRNDQSFRRLFWLIFWPLLTTILIILVRHARFGFAFSEVFHVLTPFYRNHVTYAALMALFFPFVLMALNWYPRYSRKWYIIIGGLIVLLAGIYFAYTRAAYLSLLIAGGAYYVFRWRLTRWAVLAGTFAVIGFFGYMAQNNTYLEYAPNYNKTITHLEFDDLLEATYKGEDISTMERFYRWVAGYYMVRRKPVFGYGPGNFVNFYESHTVTSFQTYVSDNPERSGIHNYFLMTAVEQGIPGLVIFLLFNFALLLFGERIYWESPTVEKRSIVMGVLMSLVVINAFLLINDLLETDKVGTLYFLQAAILVNMDLANRRLT